MSPVKNRFNANVSRPYFNWLAQREEENEEENNNYYLGYIAAISNDDSS